MTRTLRAFAVRACLAATLLVAALALPTLVPVASGAVGDCTPASSWGTLRADFGQRVIQLVNQHRAAKGLPALAVTAPLTDAAVWKARHMAAYGYMTHNDPAPPVARTTAQRFEACGYPLNAGWGENIAAGQTTPESVMTAWLGSAGHRANIENASFRALGVGVAASTSGRLYWTQTFGTSTAGSAPPAPVLGRVECSLSPRQVTVGAPTIYGRTAAQQLVGWTTAYFRYDGTTWVLGPVAPIRYAYATSTSPAQRWLDGTGSSVGTSAGLAVTQALPRAGYWLAMQMFYWYDASLNVVASTSSWATPAFGGAAAGIPGAAVCYWS